MDTHSPRRLGRYQLLERIAVGGMAEVYRALAKGLSGFEKTVVVKRLLPQHQRDQELLTMFVDEARLLGRLRHPNIAEVYDIDHDGDEYFFALEYVDGVELRDLLHSDNSEPMPQEQALWIIVELARALGYAHGLLDDDGSPLGIVHRDVSPSNVLVSQTGGVKLVDFGVAKWRAQRSETRHGVLKGKVSYMSPEQCRGEPLDMRSDIFALGVLLYEMMVGSRPFTGSSDFETLKAIADGHYVRPSHKRAGFPIAIETLCISMLELARDERPADMNQVLDAIQIYAADAGFELGPVGLSASARAARARLERSGSRTSATSIKPMADDGDAYRIAFDRTATAVAPVAGLLTHNAPKEQQRRRLPATHVALGLMALGVSIATFFIASRPGQVGQAPAASRSLVMRQAPAATPAPSDNSPALVGVLPPSKPKEAQLAARAVRSAISRGAQTKAATDKTRVTVPTLAPQTPPPTVWDPDSPVPP